MPLAYRQLRSIKALRTQWEASSRSHTVVGETYGNNYCNAIRSSRIERFNTHRTGYACQLRLKSTAIPKNKSAALSRDEIKNKDNDADAVDNNDNDNDNDSLLGRPSYIERRRQGAKWYNYRKPIPRTFERKSSLLEAATQLAPINARGIEQGLGVLDDFDHIVNSTMGVDRHQLEVTSDDEQMEIVMLRDALVNNNLDSAWGLFNSIKDKGFMHEIPPSLLSRLLITIRHTCQHRIEMALSNEQGRITNRIHINDYLYTLFEAMHQYNGRFSRPRDYAFWMLWLLQYPKSRNNKQLISGRISAAKIALNIYLKAEEQQLEDDPRLMVALSLTLWYLSHERTIKDIWISKMTLAANNLAKTKVMLHPTTFTQLLAIETDWMEATLARKLFMAAYESLHNNNNTEEEEELPAPSLSNATLRKLKIMHTHRLHTYDNAIVHLIHRRDPQILMAFEVYELMRKDGFYPKTETWTSFVTICAQQYRFSLATRLWNDRREAGLSCSFRAGRMLINRLASQKHIDDALLIYQDICSHSSRGHAIWPAHIVMIPVLLREKRLDEVDKILDTWSLDFSKRHKIRNPSNDAEGEEEEDEKVEFPSFFDSSVNSKAEPVELAKWHGRLIDAYAQQGQLEMSERLYTRLLQRVDRKYTKIKTKHWSSSIDRQRWQFNRKKP
ncbi:hypothetical protein BDF22DRAFT_681788 [Syncephalis plumigaleata]|nr:hypothetical protein BDF22DRAFT_681788 [Syncephalis plumigaleata]